MKSRFLLKDAVRIKSNRIAIVEVHKESVVFRKVYFIKHAYCFDCLLAIVNILALFGE